MELVCFVSSCSAFLHTWPIKLSHIALEAHSIVILQHYFLDIRVDLWTEVKGKKAEKSIKTD